MEGKFQYQGQIHEDLEDWLSPRGSQTYNGFLSEEDKQESIHIEGLVSEGAIISNQAPEGEISNMVVVKWSDKVEGSGDKVNATLCGRLYKEEENHLVTIIISSRGPKRIMIGLS